MSRYANLAIGDLDGVFESEDRGLLEELARTARDITGHYFGRVVSLYAPLYIANYCENRCVYCGFHAGSDIPRRKLTFEEIDRECAALAAIGIRSCLLLTGESRHHSSPAYIGQAVVTASKYFPDISIEVYPLETEEYRQLYHAGVDGVTLYQETYDRDRYDELHPKGPKKVYDYRFEAPERIAQAGIRRISMGVLLGLADWRKDVPALFRHVRSLEKKYPGVEYSLSFPRLRTVSDDDRSYFPVSDRDMVKIISVARILFPRAGVNLSTRESAGFRERIVEIGVTRMSAGSSTRVGGYVEWGKEYNDGQFEVHDGRSFAEIKAMLDRKGFDPVITDWRNIIND